MPLSEIEVHEYIEKVGLESLLPSYEECEKTFDLDPVGSQSDENGFEIFSLWRLLKKKALEKIERIHYGMYSAEITSSKLKLPIDKTQPMELDFVGWYEDGIFVLELKVNRSAERNSFTELLGYSNYFTELYVLSGARDITNILVSDLEAKITKQAYLYDLIVNDRNTLVYHPTFVGDDVQSLKLEIFIPSDSEFEYFTSALLGHRNMCCVVVSFRDLEDWFDSKEEGGSLNSWTKKHLAALSNYAAQLLESEGLHGFCYVRKPWDSIPADYRNSLIICAVNPFLSTNEDREALLSRHLEAESISALGEAASSGFLGRLIRLGQKAIRDCFTADYDCEVECPLWTAFQIDLVQTVVVHNFAFRPTGVLREAYTAYLNSQYELPESQCHEDFSVLKINEVNNWLRAWEFMRACGYFREGRG